MALPNALGEGLQLAGILGNIVSSVRFGKKLDALGPVSGSRPGSETAGGFPTGGLAPPSGDLGQRVSGAININFGGGSLTEADVRFIGGQLDKSDPGTADDFRRYVASQSGGIPFDPDTKQVIEAGQVDFDSQTRIAQENLDRQFEGIDQGQGALEAGIRASRFTLRNREQQILSTLAGSLRKGEEDIRLAQTAALLPVALMRELRDESLKKFADNSVAEMDMVSGALNARHAQEATQLRADLSSKGLNQEFIEASLQELRSDQKQQVSDQFTNIRIKHQTLRQNLDIETQKFVGFAAQTSAEQFTRVTEIGRGMRDLNLKLTQDAQFNLLSTDLAITEKEMDGKTFLADWLRNTNEIFVSYADFVEGAFSINAAQEDRVVGRLATRFGVQRDMFNQIAAEGGNIINANTEADAVAAQEQAGDQAFTGGLIQGGLTLGGSILGGPIGGVIAGSLGGAAASVGTGDVPGTSPPLPGQ